MKVEKQNSQRQRSQCVELGHKTGHRQWRTTFQGEAKLPTQDLFLYQRSERKTNTLKQREMEIEVE